MTLMEYSTIMLKILQISHCMSIILYRARAFLRFELFFSFFLGFFLVVMPPFPVAVLSTALPFIAIGTIARAVLR
jgi:hypothetical protein